MSGDGTCPVCGREKASNRKFCSKSCANRSRHKRITKKCLHCGREMVKALGESKYSWERSKYCSHACAVAERTTGKSLVKGICKNCGKTFFREKWRGRVFCSPQCASSWYIENETKEQRQKRQRKGWMSGSALSQKLCASLNEYLNRDYSNLKIYYQTLNEEYEILKPGKGKYHLDFYIEDWKIAVEFNGDFWHANPNIYSRDSKILKIPAEDIWEKDRRKIEFLGSLGIQTFIVWENEYRHNPQGILETLIFDILQAKTN